MTTPNIEELIDRLYDWHNTSAERNRLDMQKAADLLQSQAERIKELEAGLQMLAATEPVAKLKPCKEGWFIDLDNPPPITGETIELFTHPMPAQDVTELVEALEMIVSTHQGHCERYFGVSKHSYNLADIAEEALSKYKGAK